MNKRWLAMGLAMPALAAALLAALPGALPWPAVPRQAGGPVTGAERRELIETLASRLNAHYVFADKARQMAALLRERALQGAYDIDNGASLAKVLSRDLASVAHDAGLAVDYSADGESHPADRAWPAWLDPLRRRFGSYGVTKVERLPPDIGYLAIAEFAPPALAGPKYAQALDKLAGSAAIIVDLRHNRGGSIEAARLLASYFVDRPLPLNEVHYRDSGRTERPWTARTLPAPAHLGKMYVLTSRDTQAAAEDFAYAMQAMKRAAVIGETTRGAAHVASTYRLSPHFSAAIPNGRLVNPVTQANWEGIGVVPDVPAPAGQALKTIQRSILTERLAHASNAFGYIALKKLLAEL
jgi:hypothetical protein